MRTARTASTRTPRERVRSHPVIELASVAGRRRARLRAREHPPVHEPCAGPDDPAVKVERRAGEIEIDDRGDNIAGSSPGRRPQTGATIMRATTTAPATDAVTHARIACDASVRGDAARDRCHPRQATRHAPAENGGRRPLAGRQDASPAPSAMRAVASAASGDEHAPAKNAFANSRSSTPATPESDEREPRAEFDDERERARKPPSAARRSSRRRPPRPPTAPRSRVGRMRTESRSSRRSRQAPGTRATSANPGSRAPAQRRNRARRRLREGARSTRRHSGHRAPSPPAA